MMHHKRVKKLFEGFEEFFGFQTRIKWFNFISITLYHIIGAWWCYYFAFPTKWQTIIFAIIMYMISGFGVTAGAHRLWSHRSFKVKTPLKLFILMCFTIAGQNTVYEWARDHHVHHKYSDTNADPHNVNRGFFFSHIGWLMMKKNKEVIRRGNEFDLSDIINDPILRFHERYFVPLKLIFCFVLPMIIAIWLLGENWKCAVAWQCFIRYICSIHSTFGVNSLAHTFGYKPYNKYMAATQNRLVSIVTFGEGWHNYHHAFPFDYKHTQQLEFLDWGTHIIRLCAKLGWAYDLKEATPEMINSMSKRLGDGTIKQTFC